VPVEHPLYPVNLVVDGRPCLVVGGGRVATGKVRGLREAGALVTVIAPEIEPAIAGLDGVAIERRAYRRGDVAGYWFVVAATGDPQVNQSVYDDGGSARDGSWSRSPRAGTAQPWHHG
jgi:siroheme synthase-like protein